MTTRKERLQAIIEKADRMKARALAQRRAIEARERREAAKLETRKKILIGALILERVKRGEMSEAALKDWLDGFLKRDYDRAVFGLPAMKPEQPAEATGGAVVRAA